MGSRRSTSSTLDDKDSVTHHDLESTPAVVSVEPENDTPHHSGAGLKAWLQVLSAFFVFFNTW